MWHLRLLLTGAIITLVLTAARLSSQPPTVAPTKPHRPCFDTVHRYVDCRNGTVTDTVTGLVWLKNASCLGNHDWAAAHGRASRLAAGQCGLADGSTRGDWRLPTLREWQATIARAGALGCTTPGPGNAPTLTDDAGTACLHDGTSSFTGVRPGPFWSASTDDRHPNNAWVISLDETVHGHAYIALKRVSLPVWPVR